MFAPPATAEMLHILKVKTPETTQRDIARQLVRQAIRTALAKLLAVDEESISLISSPGQPIRLTAPWDHVGISVSHEPGLSLAAINLAGPVGIDLLRVGVPLAEIDALARDYLGPTEAIAIASTPLAQRQMAFALAWARLEARLKCLALPLIEWTPALAEQLATCTVTELVVPTGWVAAVATLSANLSPVAAG
ncbi:MAG: 4'-phosphopantetheinyl transferase superfamily protein [Azonexus sp.]|nr:4'-phosphopantetheinyl transferase superfamily protein [Azonexus sp.]